MAAKAILALCASALFVQTISAACCGNNNIGSIGLGYGSGLGGSSFAGLGSSGYGLGGLGNSGCGNVAVASGGGLPVCLASPISPSGVSLRSENGIEGLLDICGALPVLSAVAFDTILPTAGSAGVQYSCGNGAVGITSADNAAGLSGSAGYAGAALGGIGNRALIGNAGSCGCGCY